MEIINFSNLKIEVSSEELYELNSTDNVKEYDCIYSSYNTINKDYIYAPKYGIIVKDEEIILRSALLVGGGGSTAPHKRSALIDNDSLIVILGDSIFSISLPDLSINWVTVCEQCLTCFEIFNCIDGYIIHGELSILKINKLGKVKWEFFGRDIFTTIDSVDDFKVYDNYIIAKDWEYNVYKIDIKKGIEIK